MKGQRTKSRFGIITNKTIRRSRYTLNEASSVICIKAAEAQPLKHLTILTPMCAYCKMDRSRMKC
jgi:hypothetical protein